MATIKFHTTRLLTISDIMLLSQCGRNTARNIKNLINSLNNKEKNQKPTLREYQIFYNENVKDIEVQIN